MRKRECMRAQTGRFEHLRVDFHHVGCHCTSAHREQQRHREVRLWHFLVLMGALGLLLLSSLIVTVCKNIQYEIALTWRKTAIGCLPTHRDHRRPSMASTQVATSHASLPTCLFAHPLPLPERLVDAENMAENFGPLAGKMTAEENAQNQQNGSPSRKLRQRRGSPTRTASPLRDVTGQHNSPVRARAEEAAEKAVSAALADTISDRISQHH